jgi:hypothetical protein
LTLVNGGIDTKSSTIDPGNPGGNTVVTEQSLVEYITSVSGIIVDQIPTDFYTTGEVDTISGDIMTQVDDELDNLRFTLGGTVYYFVDEDSADLAGYEILSVAPGGNPEDTDQVTITSASGLVMFAQYVTPSGLPRTTLIPAGEWISEMWAAVDNTGSTNTITTSLYKRDAVSGTETLLWSSTTSNRFLSKKGL